MAVVNIKEGRKTPQTQAKFFLSMQCVDFFKTNILHCPNIQNIPSNFIKILFLLIRFERSQSEDPRPSVWQRFRSFDDSDLRRTGAERPFQTGTLPRPRATVKPLPVPPVQPEFPGSSPDKAGENSGKHLAVVRKPDFSSTEEGKKNHFNVFSYLIILIFLLINS